MEYIKGKLGLPTNHENNANSDNIERYKIECTGRAYLHGLVVGPLTFSLVYFTQNFFTKNIKVRISNIKYDSVELRTMGKFLLERFNL